MKRLSLALVALGLLCPGLAAAQVPPPTRDYAISVSPPEWGGVFADLEFSLYPYLSFRLDASSGPSGENPAGTLSWNFGTPGYNESVDTASVTCLTVTGNRAVIGGFGLRRIGGYIFDPAVNPAPPPEDIGFFLIAVDNGPFVLDPNTPLHVGPDQAMLIEPAGSTPPRNCPGVSSGSLFLVGGDLVVHDAPPMPTSKQQCKNGGWRAYGVFKNQGDCVRRAET